MSLCLEQSLDRRWSQTIRWTFPHWYHWSYTLWLFPFRQELLCFLFRPLKAIKLLNTDNIKISVRCMIVRQTNSNIGANEKKGHLFVFIGQTTSDLLSPKWILTKCIDFDGCLWWSRGSVLSWSYHASVHFIILRASNSQSGSLGLVLFECSFNGTGYHFITLFPCYGCFFSFQTKDFTGDSGACADKCIFAYCFDSWKILIMSQLNL